MRYGWEDKMSEHRAFGKKVDNFFNMTIALIGLIWLFILAIIGAGLWGGYHVLTSPAVSKLLGYE